MAVPPAWRHRWRVVRPVRRVEAETFSVCAPENAPAPAPRKILSSRPDSGIPSLQSRNSRIGQAGKTAFIFPMLRKRLEVGTSPVKILSALFRDIGPLKKTRLTIAFFCEAKLAK